MGLVVSTRDGVAATMVQKMWRGKVQRREFEKKKSGKGGKGGKGKKKK